MTFAQARRVHTKKRSSASVDLSCKYRWFRGSATGGTCSSRSSGTAQDGAHSPRKRIRRIWFLNEAGNINSNVANGYDIVGVAGCVQHLQVRPGLVQSRRQFMARQSRQHNIREQEVDPAVQIAGHLQRLGGMTGSEHGKSVLPQRPDAEGPDALVVFDEQNRPRGGLRCDSRSVVG